MPTLLRRRAVFLVVAWALGLAGGVPSLAAPADAEEPAGAEAASGFQQDYLRELETVVGKLAALAAEIPAERYAWRPAPEVRSVSEVLVHIAWTNEALLARIDGEPPPRPREVEQTLTEKAEVTAYLEESFDEARRRVESLSDAKLEQKVQAFGGSRTARFVLLRLLNHAHEHLGQLIVYARLLEIAPPWSR